MRIEAQWSPFIAAVSERSGICLTARVSSGGSQFDSRLALGEPSFAVPTPSALVKLAGTVRYEPLVRSGLRRARGVLVVRADSGLERPSDLATAAMVDVGVPSPTARFISLEPQRELRRAGVRCRAIDFGDPSNVLRAVALGRVPVGASVDLVLAEYEPAIREQLRVIFATRPHLAPPLSAHPRVPPRVREAVAGAVLRMQHDDAGRALLDAVRLTDPVPTDRSEYEADLGDVPNLTEGCTAMR